ncbi:MAG: hypothetical protein JW991_02210 [Candidatus Pacebacteria bacterium]|nr:hypothetical protein [Candidatus Paceibacterota bacterium]
MKINRRQWLFFVFLALIWPFPSRAQEACFSYPAYPGGPITVSGRVSAVIGGTGLFDKMAVKKNWNFNKSDNAWNWRESDFFSLEAGIHYLVIGEGMGAKGDSYLDQFSLLDSGGGAVFSSQAEDYIAKYGKPAFEAAYFGVNCLFFKDSSQWHSVYQVNIPAAGDYRLNARIRTDWGGGSTGKGLQYTWYQTDNLADLGETVRVTIPAGGTIRADDVYLFWEGESQMALYRDDEATVRINGVAVTAPESNLVFSYGHKTHWVQVPAGALSGAGNDYDFNVTGILDFNNSRMAVRGFGLWVPYQDLSLPDGSVFFQPWGQLVRNNLIEGEVYPCVGDPISFQFAPAGEREFFPFFFGSGGQADGYDANYGLWKPNYLQWATGTGLPLSGGYSWSDVPLTGALSPPDKTTGYFVEARDGEAWDSISVSKGIINSLTIPAGNEWIAFRLRAVGDGVSSPEEPINSFGESMAWHAGGGFQPAPVPCVATEPEAPVSISPDTDQGLEVTFDWNHTGVWGESCDTCSPSFTVYLEDQATYESHPGDTRVLTPLGICSDLSAGQTDCDYSFLPADDRKRYVWQIEAHNCGNQCGFSADQPCSARSGVLTFMIKINADAWFQTIGGDIHAEGVIDSNIPSAAAPSDFFSLSEPSAVGDEGVVSYGGVSADFGAGAVSDRDWLVSDDLISHYDFAYFYQKLGSPTIDNLGNGSIPLPVTDELAVYYSADNVNLTGGDIPDNREIILLINGDLTISGDINVEIDGFLGVFVAGNINISGAAAQVEGLYFAGGLGSVIDTCSSAPCGEEEATVQLVAEGALVAPVFNLGRSLPDNDSPAEVFLFRPDLIINSPMILWRTPQMWQELAP